MIITHTPTVEGRCAVEYLGTVSGQYVNGMSLIAHILERVRGAFGGRSGFHEGEITETRERAIAAMLIQAETLGADAVISFSTSYSMISGGRVVLVVASGTAVRLADG